MKKPKINLDAAKIQQFFFYHIEKMLLVVVVGVMGFLIWKGFSLKGLDDQMSPQALKQESETARAYIENPNRWNEVKGVREPELNVESLVKAAQLKTDPLAYSLPVSINRPNFPKHNLRTDPKLFPPEHLIAVAEFGPLAVLAKMGDVDPLPQFTETSEPPPVRTLPKSKAKTPPGFEGPLGSPDGGPGPGPGGRTKKGRQPRGGGEGFDPLGGSQPEIGPGPAGIGGMPGAVDPTIIYPESISHGFMAQNEYTLARNTGAVVVSAVVPYVKQLDEFDRALAQSLDFDSSRDFPWYLNFEIQRADVTADPVGAIDWSTAMTIDPRGIVLRQIGRQEMPGEWAGLVTDVVDPNYVDPKLTHPAPPFLQRDLWPLLTHPDVPLATAFLGGEGAPGEPGSAPPGEDPNELFGPGPGGQAGPGGLGGAGQFGSADGGRGVFRGGGEGGGRPGGFNPGYAGPTGTAGPTTVAPPKFKLIRFTDTEVKSGRKYSYRLRVWLHDPNHPTAGMAPPSIASLDGAVQKRIKAVDEEVRTNKRKPQYASVVMSDWSTPSAPVELPATSRFFAVKTIAPTMREVVPGKPVLANDQPKAETLVVGWDGMKVVDVPGEITVQRGSMLNFTQDVKVIHPATKVLIDLPKHPVATGAIVADMLGGELIPPLEKGSPNAVNAPGELLIIDASGKLHVRNEVDDIENIRRYGIPKPVPVTTPNDGGLGGEQPSYDPLGTPDGPRPKGRARP